MSVGSAPSGILATISASSLVHWSEERTELRGMGVREPDGFREYVTARSPALMRAAWLLTGNEAAAEDLVQSALVRIWPRWAKLDREGSIDAYMRRVLVTTYINGWRRRWRGEVPTEVLPDGPAAVDAQAAVDQRLLVRQALADLPPRQRAVVVLRYFEDLTEAQAAQALGCSVGTVKSQTAKALARLRTHPWLAPADLEEVEEGHDVRR
jgi:RNA polymerase sigma-70 factor (sigma-E family)